MKILIILLLQFVIGPQPVPENDHRPPVVSVAITSLDKQFLTDAQKRVADAQSALDEARSNLDDINRSIVKKHRTTELEEPRWCGEVGYVARIERGFVIYTLQRSECHPV